MRYTLHLAACLTLCTASASETVRNWQEGTLMSAEAYKEAPAPSDAVAVTESDAPGRVMINRALEKLIGLPGQRSWSNFWGYVIDTTTLRYIAISKRAINIPVGAAMKCTASGDRVYLLDESGKELRLKLIKATILGVSRSERARAAPQISQQTATAAQHEASPTSAAASSAPAIHDPRPTQPETSQQVVSVASPSTGDGEPQNAEEAYRRAVHLVQTQHLNDAVSMFNRAVMLKPDWALAFAARARALYESKKYVEAISDCDAAIRLDPTHAEWYDLRGLAYSYSGQHARALEDYNRAIDMNSNIAAYYNNRGWAYRELGQPQKAIADLTTTIQMSPAFAIGYENRAIAFAQLKDWARAIADYTAAIQLNPVSRNYQKRAEARLSIGDRNGAEEDQRKVAQLDSAAQGQQQGVNRVGNGISPPVVLYKVDPTYTEEARSARYSGTVVLQVIVDPGGFARDIKVVRSLGMGLDDKAIEAVRKWKFRPGYKNGQAVAVQATIEVNFRLFEDATK